MSFGDDADDGEPVQFKKKPIFRADRKYMVLSGSSLLRVLICSTTPTVIDDGSAGKAKQSENAERVTKIAKDRGAYGSTSDAVKEALNTPEIPSKVCSGKTPMSQDVDEPTSRSRRR